MPVLVVGGKVRDKWGKGRVAGACEWCGEEFTEDDCRTVQEMVADEDLGEVGGEFVLTRVCRGCIHVYSRLAADGVTERA